MLIVPILCIGFGLDHRKASGTSLGVVMFVAAAGVAVDLISGDPAARPAILAALLVAPPAMLAARTVAPMINRLPTAVLRRIFAVVVLVVVVRLFGLPPFGAAQSDGLLAYGDMAWPMFVVLPLIGLCMGGLGTLVGIGGGLILIPALGFLFHDLTWLQCRATSLLVVAPTAFLGLQRHLDQGTAELRCVRMLAPACVVGAVVGSWVAHRADSSLFQHAFAGFLLFVGLRLLLIRRST